jgi:hypothetical protein
VIVDAAQWWQLDLDAARSVAQSVAARSDAELLEVSSHEYAGSICGATCVKTAPDSVVSPVRSAQ